MVFLLDGSLDMLSFSWRRLTEEEEQGAFEYLVTLADTLEELDGFNNKWMSIKQTLFVPLNEDDTDVYFNDMPMIMKPTGLN